MERDKVIIKVSIQSIIVNLILVSFKMIVGLISHSIAIILDAVNNLSDALSQVVTIVAMKLAAREPDQKHPFGYGRIEYLSSVIIAALILMAGFTSLKESIEKVFHPEPAEYSYVSLLIIAVAVAVKFLFGRYVKKTGKKVNSGVLVASGTDCMMDSVLSTATLAAALIYTFFHVSLEGILSAFLSLFIIRAGLELLLETISSLIGDRSDHEFVQELKKRIRGIDGVLGAYDLILHDYGPSRSIGSVHIEVPDTMTAQEIHHLTREVTDTISEEYGIMLTVGLYASSSDPEVLKMKHAVTKLLPNYEHVKQMHGFYADREEKRMLFDIVVSFHAKSAAEVCQKVHEDVQALFPDYRIDINIDRDFSD